VTRQKIRIATRKSKLALWQASFIRDRLHDAHPNIAVELLEMTTQGDKWLSSPLSQIGGKGLFIKELEQALLDDAADIAVHSMKDVPATLPEGFCMPVIAYRADIRDALVGSTMATAVQRLPPGAIVGSSSLRRQAQLLHRRPDVIVKPVRGNVGTRLEKLDAGDYDAIILAAAGLKRLGLESRISEYMSVEESLPAAGQGALGIECRSDYSDMDLLEALSDHEVFTCVSAERRVSEGLGADCSMPLAAYCIREGEQLLLQAILADQTGKTLLRASARGHDWQALGSEVTDKLLQQGAEDILQSLTDASS